MKVSVKCLLLLLALWAFAAPALSEESDPYNYILLEKMPIVRIKTTEEDASFIWRYSRSDKQAGLIDYVPAHISLTRCDDEHRLYSAPAQVKVRGNYTLEYMKKSIRIKFENSQHMMHLGNGKKYKNWVLLADWKDLSLLNNPAAFYLGNAILEPDGYYCTDFCPVEVYINDTYWGVYLLVEQQEIKSGRTSLTETKKTQESWQTSYLFELDGYAEDELLMPEGKGDPIFSIQYYKFDGNVPSFTVKSDINHPRQLEFLQSYVEKAYFIVYSALYNDKYYFFDPTYTTLILRNDATAREAISQVIDIQSLVDVYLLNEICCNPDAGWSSFYMGLDMTARGEKKLVFEAPWDFDSAFGIRRSFEMYDLPFEANFTNPWLAIFRDVPWFQDMVQQKWQAIRARQVPEKALQLILDYTARYKLYYLDNYRHWNARVLHGNHEVVDAVNAGKTQQEAAEYMYTWLEGRIAYLDQQWLPAP